MLRYLLSNNWYLTSIYFFVIIWLESQSKSQWLSQTVLKETNIGLPPVLRLGAVFSEEQRSGSIESAFKYALYRINKDHSILPSTQLVYDIIYVSKDDTFRSTKQLCHQLENNIQVIFGPNDPMLSIHIHSICQCLGIPHILIHLDYHIPIFRDLAINLYPSQQQINAAYEDFFLYNNWTKFAVIYEGDYGVFRQNFMNRSSTLRTRIYIHRATQYNYRNILRSIRDKDIYKIIIDTNPANFKTLFRMILQMQMNDYRYHYLFTTFNLDTFDLEDFKYNNVNIGAFRLVDSKNKYYQDITMQMRKLPHSGIDIIEGQPHVLTESALIFDAVYVFAAGLTSLTRKYTLNDSNVSCSLDQASISGRLLYNYMNTAVIYGLTGKIEFEMGRRKNVRLYFLQLNQQYLKSVGIWTINNGLKIANMSVSMNKNINGLNNTLVITIVEEQPFVMFKGDVNLTGNARFEGFFIDFLQAISVEIGFNYTFRLIKDKMFGVYNLEKYKWNEILNKLRENKADLAITLYNQTIENFVDYTKPFINTDFGILFKIPRNPSAHLFSFMKPFTMEIWFYMLSTYILVSFVLFVMARFSPYEWHTLQPYTHPCLNVSDIVENQFSLSNSFWFITGTFFLRRSGLNPKAISTRIVGGIWGFFTLIIISSYTANLAAFLTIERIITPIQNVVDLVQQTDITYGTLEYGSAMSFLRDSKITTYRNMWKYMEKHRMSVLVKTYDEGIKRVLKGNYAFVVESTFLNNAINRNCNLSQIGGVLGTISYVLATPKGSQWRDEMSAVVHKFEKNGFIQSLYNKWMETENNLCNCSNAENENKFSIGLNLDNMAGIFIILLCGLATAVIISTFEYFYTLWKYSKQTERQFLCSEISNEFHDAVYPWNLRANIKEFNCYKCQGYQNQ